MVTSDCENCFLNNIHCVHWFNFQEKCMEKCKQRFMDLGDVLDSISVNHSSSNGNMCSCRQVAWRLRRQNGGLEIAGGR